MLPKLTVKLVERNPNYVPKYSSDDCRPYNMDEYQAEYEIEVEVVQLNLNTGGMRVRWNEPDADSKKGYRVESQDVSIQYFYDQYQITPKD